ncbi:Transcriptional regulator, LysR family [Leucobacter sp. 7(1)]|uniref:LysR family transcriptional regulator n=1 Tax=Leucobacter sp. 7(1) TaxID=1255613 RepID=UPI00097ED7E0|nr:LysR family transcriptional regulator [Leucobacter sp. 7(1)]SJN11263.1 Transcriptional regulator, LysR family [Leucobacter sp. 7(1)]
MQIRLLRCFEAVARLGSLAAASAELHVTQPALSRQLKDLERSTGFDLFDRGGYRLTLTRAGRDFLPHTRKVLLAAAQLDEIVRTQGASPESQLVIACPSETARHIIAPMIAQGRVATARIISAPADDVLRLLAAGECDIAVGTGVPPQDLAHEVIGAIPITVQHARGSWAPIDDPESAAMADIGVLTAAPLVTVEHYRGVRRAVADACAAAGVVPGPARVLALPEVAQAYAARHGGLCLMSGEPALFGLRSTPLAWEGRPLRIPLRAAWANGGALDPQIRHVVAQLSGSESLDPPGALWQAPRSE